MGFIDRLSPFAIKHGRAHGVLPSLIVAQGILESASGTSELAIKANNLFGIKSGSGWSDDVYTKRTAEHKTDGTIYYIDADFREYPTFEGCVIDLVNKYVNGTGWEPHNRYASVLNQTDYKKATAAVKAAGYETDVNYPEKLNKLIEQYELTKYDKEGDNVVKIALDAGHGINTAGKRTPDGEREWSFNNKVLLACAAKLNKYQDVQILRLDDPTGNTDVPLVTRTNKANAWGAGALVSIHHNAFAGKWGSHGGVETLVQEITASKASKDIAAIIQPRIVQAMGLRNRGAKTDNLHMLRESNMPAILTEGGFMDSTTDIGALRSDAKLKAQGEAIADGLAVYFKLKLKVAGTPAPPKEDEELKFSSPALKTETETSLVSKAHRQIIVAAAIKAGAHTSWTDKLENNTLTDADVLGLAVKYTVAVNK
ncbi:N-acetylmuramoyl-L-alanine amidase [Sporosarcina sp. resist]|uniref:N-acetylmuramoyl-L-alanine amidase n=1 Tax=Sporosarcina sp. resist TaxID=2762563 RepID=UPI00164CE338|nr:N-acetylmuramoyl-L-alanine amidase [Sporosarcina sp. resist]QNK89457.1 N-acetylmuramoyl-L-alanine amidase [Sporosarcina sp. resist]